MLIKKIKDEGLFPAKWVGCDSFFGSDHAFLDEIARDFYYFAGIRSNTHVWLKRPKIGLPPYKGRGHRPKKARPLTKSIHVSEIAKDPSLPWKSVNVGEGAKGPILADIVRLRVIECRDGLPEEERWLFMRRCADGTIRYTLSNAPEDIPMEEMIRVARMRWPIEQSFQEGKSHLGMDCYEIRSYPGWHRHMTLVFLAQLFLLEVRFMFTSKKKKRFLHFLKPNYCSQQP